MLPKLISSLIDKFKGKNEDAPATAKVVIKHEPTPEEKVQYIKIVEEIDRMISSGEIMGVKKKELGHCISYYLGNKKVCDINKDLHPPRTYFLFSGANHLARELKAEGLRPLTKNEAKQKGYGHVKALYSGTDLEIIRSMVLAIK